MYFLHILSFLSLLSLVAAVPTYPPTNLKIRGKIQDYLPPRYPYARPPPLLPEQEDGFEKKKNKETPWM